MAVALLALFVALAGTAVAAAPPVKQALFARNAGKLQGKTARQVAAMPGPANGVARLMTLRTGNFPLAADEAKDISISCQRGRAVSGGFSSPGTVTTGDSRLSDPQTYSLYVINGSETAATTISLQVLCAL
jgi:hypothetical protein